MGPWVVLTVSNASLTISSSKFAWMNTEIKRKHVCFMSLSTGECHQLKSCYFHSPNTKMQLTCVVVSITRRGVKIARFVIFTSPGGYPTYFPVIHNWKRNISHNQHWIYFLWVYFPVQHQSATCNTWFEWFLLDVVPQMVCRLVRLPSKKKWLLVMTYILYWIVR